MSSDDRRVLEDRIFPALFKKSKPQRILSVGCHRYSAWYASLFGANPLIRFETVDTDPAAAIFGAKEDHHICRFSELAEKDNLVGVYDIIFINGVFGYGIDTDEQKKTALQAASTLLRRDGLIVIGYRDGPLVCDLDTRLVDKELFEFVNVPGFSTLLIRTRNSNGHVFSCLRKIRN